MPLAPCETLRAFLFHPTLGVAYDIEIRVPTSPDVVSEVVLDASYAISARLLDRSEVVQGVRIWIRHLKSPLGRPFRSPDSKGEVMWTGIGEGMYELRASAPGYWSVTSHVEAERGKPNPVDIQFRRTGDLEVLLEDSVGKPVVGLEIGLRPLDQDGVPSEWVAEQRVNAPTGLASGQDGRVVFQGLPRGLYEVEVEAPGLPKKKRKVEVPAGGKGSLEFRL